MAVSVKHFIIVNGYGVHIEAWFKTYLFKVIKFFNELPESDFPILIFCGGETDPAVWTTEAEVMSEFFSAHVDWCPGSRDYHSWEEVVSLTAYGKISRSADLIEAPQFFPLHPMRNHIFSSTKITIFCEANQSKTIMMLARHFLLRFVSREEDLRLETESRDRSNPLKQAWSLTYNKLAIKFPRLGLAEREHRRRMHRALGS